MPTMVKAEWLFRATLALRSQKAITIQPIVMHQDNFIHNIIIPSTIYVGSMNNNDNFIYAIVKH